MIYIPISYGELIDKITILQIKRDNIADPDKLTNINNELAALDKIVEAEKLRSRPNFEELFDQLFAANRELWDLENRIRELMRPPIDEHDFVETGTSIHNTNDRRSVIKRRINLEWNSELIEEKSYDELNPTVV